MDGAVTRYAKTPDGDSIAYQVLGDGPFDLVYVPGFISHLEMFWNHPGIAAFYRRLASFSRLILFDKRGTGLSDPLPGPQPMEERAEDVIAVMDAVGSTRAALVGVSEGCAFATVFAATHPDRTRAIVLCGPIVGGAVDEHPAGEKWPRAAARFRRGLDDWGAGRTLRLVAPTSAVTTEQMGQLERAAASPRMARELIDMWMEIDLRDVLPSVAVPTLILHRTGEIFPIEAARDIAGRIPDARLVELPGDDHVPWEGDTNRYAGEIEEFLTGVRERRRSNRVLGTLVFTDLVDSTALASDLGDDGWQRCMARHDDVVRRQLRRFDGREVKHTGDGFLMLFDGPARALRCATAIVRALADEIGVDARAGIHTGEVELVDTDVRGLAVHVASRVEAHARRGEVLASNTVKELVLGSGIEFEDRGTHALRGVPDDWRLHAVVAGST
jgi:pimeloyl-ACP methyl ester carboxylesterase